jgi:predicted amidophosphoribosyltransferase
MRASNIRQLGANRRERLSQLENEFIAKNKKKIVGKNILIIDDITTTGASIASSASALYGAGARSVSALLYAQKI